MLQTPPPQPPHRHLTGTHPHIDTFCPEHTSLWHAVQFMHRAGPSVLQLTWQTPGAARFTQLPLWGLK